MSTASSTITDFIHNSLNAQQQQAVLTKKGVLLVVAGAGSGKTRVITARIANLIVHEGVVPGSIVALTFTNKAAQEMRERIHNFVGNKTEIPFIGTFHSYCLRLLKQYNHLLPSPFLSIMDEDDQQKLLSAIIQRNNLQKRTTAKKLAYQISQLKNSSIDPEQQLHTFEWSSPFMRDVYHAYEREKQASRCLDFDDLLLHTVKLFRNNPGFKQQFQDRVKHILVDEYQDTNVVQHALLKELALAHTTFTADSLCVVGDEDQSIYSWRGATVTNIINFKKDFPQTITIKIEQNYRSVQPILTCANEVIKNNKERNPKNLWSERSGSDRIRILSCLSEYQEGELITHFLKTAQKVSQQVAILYRAHYQSRAIEEALIKHSIPYTIIGGIAFYERKEIKDLLAYLRLAANPFDRASFSRIINCPQRGLGEKFEEEFFSRWQAHPLYDFKHIAQMMIQEDVLPRTKKAALIMFVTLFDTISPDDRPSVALDRILTMTSYMSYLKTSYEGQEAESRMDNVKELLHAVRYLEEQGLTTISSFLDDVALMQDKLAANNPQQDASVVLMTLHAAKGLEFDTVIIAGLEEGLLPSSRSLQEDQGLEEERRLLYVGITRAKERLLLTTCRYRYTYGQMSAQAESRFLEEIPTTLAPRHDASSLSTIEAQRLFTQWLGLQQTHISGIVTFGPAQKQPLRNAIPDAQHSESSKTIVWKRNQPVIHTTFGTGIIQNIEPKDDTVYLTIAFRIGTKKIDAKFIRPL
jgi:DNA helicase-2/ATP-dependent DNA helicase PcrA